MMCSSAKKGNGVVGSYQITSRIREIVFSMKEIVNCNEQEIYAALRECDMDPNEAVQRLLNQDTFHEVRSKREKKKESKGTSESRSQRLNSIPCHGITDGAADRGGHSSSVQNNSHDNGIARGKPVCKKENGINCGAPTSSNFAYGAATNCNSSAVLLSHDSMKSTVHATGQPGICLPSQPSSAYHHSRSGMPDQLSMADIVKMGRPQRKPSSTPTTTTLSLESLEFHSSQFPVLKSMEIGHVPTSFVSENKPFEECSVVDKPPEGCGLIISGICVSGDYATFPELPASSSLHAGESDLHLRPEVDDTGNFRGAILVESLQTEPKISNRQLDVDDSAGVSCLDDGSLENTDPYQSQMHLEAKIVDEALSAAVADFQHLSLPHDLQGATPAEENPAVIIPDHLQVSNADCSHLSFGTFGSASASLPVAITSNVLGKEPVLVVENASLPDQSDEGKFEYYTYDRLGTASDDSVARGGCATSRNYDMASVSQPDAIRDDTFDVVHRPQHDIPSFSSHSFPCTTQANDAAYYHAEAKLQMQSPSLSSLLAMNPGLFSKPQPSPQIVSSTTVATGPAFPRHRPASPYSQRVLSPGYPLPPQMNSYDPFPSSSSHQQSPSKLAGMKYTLPQYKYSIPLNDFPQSTPVAASGYGGLGISAYTSGSFPQNPSTGAASTNIGYEEVLRSQFKEGGHFSPFHQSEDSLWRHGAGGSRTVPSVPAGMYYAFQGQNGQQGSSILRQLQQSSQMGMMGYPISYQAQTGGFSGEHQQQLLSTLGDLNGYQSRRIQQSQWQHNY